MQWSWKQIVLGVVIGFLAATVWFQFVAATNARQNADSLSTAIDSKTQLAVCQDKLAALARH